ncbi:hypothetical protein [Paraburkholderia sp. J12]|uniref:hypothetical protein n=1 Tax=Paraburkholderia sp. J12 TaxID=2805432 RepID=UPI002ABD6869|nr:hypothetical protein [Paraburkholderia sp. J12]
MENHHRFCNWNSQRCYFLLFNDDHVFRRVQAKAARLIASPPAGDSIVILAGYIESLLTSRIPRNLDGYWLYAINRLIDNVSWFEVAQEFFRFHEGLFSESNLMQIAEHGDVEDLIIPQSFCQELADRWAALYPAARKSDGRDDARPPSSPESISNTAPPSQTDEPFQENWWKGHVTKPETKTLKLLDGDIHTILAALRLYQDQGMAWHGNRPPCIDDIATNCGESASYDSEDIDALCERINLGLNPEGYSRTEEVHQP